MARTSKPHIHRGRWRTRINGREIDLGPAADERQAQAAFHRLMAAAIEPEPADRVDTVTGAAMAWQALNPKPVYRDWLRPLVHWAGQKDLAALDRDFLTRYHVHLRTLKAKRRMYDRKGKRWYIGETDKPLSDETVRHYMRTAAAVLNWAADQEWCKRPVAPKLSEPVRKPRDLDDAAVSAMLGELAPETAGRAERAGRALRFMLATGCRPGEVAGLEWSQVHADKAMLLLPRHKTSSRGGRVRTVYLSADALAILAELKPTPGPVFLNGDGNPYKPSGLRSIMRRHTPGKRTPYSLRHTYAQHGREDGVQQDELAALLGHRDLRATRRYYEIRDDQAAAAVKRIKLPGVGTKTA